LSRVQKGISQEEVSEIPFARHNCLKAKEGNRKVFSESEYPSEMEGNYNTFKKFNSGSVKVKILSGRFFQKFLRTKEGIMCWTCFENPAAGILKNNPLKQQSCLSRSMILLEN